MPQARKKTALSDIDPEAMLEHAAYAARLLKVLANV